MLKSMMVSLNLLYLFTKITHNFLIRAIKMMKHFFDKFMEKDAECDEELAHGYAWAFIMANSHFMTINESYDVEEKFLETIGGKTKYVDLIQKQEKLGENLKKRYQDAYNSDPNGRTWIDFVGYAIKHVK